MIPPDVSTAEPLRTFDWTGYDFPSQAVVLTVADLLDADPRRIEPLQNTIDTDAVDNLFTQVGQQQNRPNGSIEFEYQGYAVIIKAHGRGYVYDAAEIADSCTEFERETASPLDE